MGTLDTAVNPKYMLLPSRLGRLDTAGSLFSTEGLAVCYDRWKAQPMTETGVSQNREEGGGVLKSI